jgi:hypothetical protein
MIHTSSGNGSGIKRSTGVDSLLVEVLKQWLGAYKRAFSPGASQGLSISHAEYTKQTRTSQVFAHRIARYIMLSACPSADYQALEPVLQAFAH